MITLRLWIVFLLRPELYRDVIDTTQIGDYIDRYEMGDLHARMRGIPVPCWLAMFVVTGTFNYVKRGQYKRPYKHHPVFNGAYTPPEALLAEGYAAGGGLPWGALIVGSKR